MGDHVLHPTEAVKELRACTGMSIALCASAWKEANGSINKALEILKAKGATRAEKLYERSTSAAFVGMYRHHDGRTVALFPILAETDFVTNMAEVRNLAEELAMHVAASGQIPMWMDLVDYDTLLSQEVLTREGCTIRELLQQLSAKTGEKIGIGQPVLVKL